MQTATQVFIKSPFTQVVLGEDSAIIWHSLFGHPKTVSLDTIDFLNQFVSPTSLEDAFGGELDEDDANAVRALVDSFYLVDPLFDERAHLERAMASREASIVDGSRISFLELIMSEACNFRCTYCIHFNNLETSTRISNPEKFMKFTTAQNAVDEFLAYLRMHGRRDAVINFGGGEPLQAWPVMKRVLEYCTSTYGQEFDFTFSINTNASLVTPVIAEVLNSYNVNVAASLDGNREGNNAVRLTKKGGGTYDKVVAGMQKLSDAGLEIDGYAVTITAENFDHLNEGVIDYALEKGMTEVRIDIDVVGMVDVPVEDIVDKLSRIRRYAMERGVDVPGFWSRAFENMGMNALETDIAFCGAVRGNSMCVSPNGSIYGCGYSTTKLGDLTEIDVFHVAGGNYHKFVRDHLTGTMEMCKGCMIEAQCAGGCNITQEFSRATNSAKIERMCDFYRRMTVVLVGEQLV